MIDEAHPIASWFLWIVGPIFLALFAVPILIAPLAWAKRIGWTIPEDVRLTRYFGRCLGAVGLALVALCFRMAPSPSPFLFELLAAVAVLLAIVHAWGALERSQPAIENIEIALYTLLAGAAIWIRFEF
jgi:hypothetical protein